MAKKKKAKPVTILIGVPILAWTHEFATSFLRFWTDVMTYQHKGREVLVGYKFMYRKPVHMAEEELAQYAIDSGCTHLLLMDDDIYDVTAEDLFKLVDADKDVIGGIMHTKGFPYAMCAFRRYDVRTKVAAQSVLHGPARLYEVPEDQRHGVQPVDLIPFAFTLIKTEVFKMMRKPWFKCDNQAPTDSWFADRILNKKLGYYAHFDVWLNHNGITKANRHLWFQLGVHQQQAANGQQIIELNAEEMRMHEAAMALKLKNAESKVKRKHKTDTTFYKKSEGHSMGVPVS
jgi:hypothetical protein